MLVLDTTSKTITVAMSGAAATTNPSFVTAYSDDNGTTFVEGSSDGILNGTTQVTMVAAPAASTRRLIKSIFIENNDTAPVTIIVTLNNSGTLRNIQKVTLAVGDNWSTDGVIDSNGNFKQLGASGYSGYSGFSGFSGLGVSGYSGYSGYSGISGYSGSGVSGYSGYSGSGVSGYSGFSGISVTTNTAQTWTATQTFNGSSSTFAEVLLNAAETTTISATSATGTINFYINSQSVLYYTSNASANWTLNVAFSSGTSLNTAMSTGQTVTLAFLNTNGSTAYYASAFTIDGTSVTPKWQGGTAPNSGNASATDVYTYTIVKTGSAAYTVLASQTKFA